jgi:sugar phosphate isomerase/epimerase
MTLAISMWTSYLIELMPEELVETYVKYGWQASELSDEHAHDLLKSGKPGAVGEAFGRFAADQGMSFPQGHFLLATKGCRPDDLEGRNIADIAPEDDGDFAAVMDTMKNWVELFAAIGIKAGVLHCGGQRMLAKGCDPQQIFQRRCQAVATVADFAAGSGLNICLENLFMDGSRQCSDLLAIINEIKRPNVGICLDTGHANARQVDIPDFIHAAGSHLKALHIADNLGQNDDHMLPFGRGTVPWLKVMPALREVGYSGLFNFEVPGENRCPMPIRLAKLRYAKTLAEQMLQLA